MHRHASTCVGVSRYFPLAATGAATTIRAAATIGRTLCVNPGSSYGEGTLQGVLVTLDGDRVKGHQFVSG